MPSGRRASPRVAVAPVVAASGDQPHAVAIALQPQPVAVVFHFVEPVGAVRDDGGLGGEAEIEGAMGIGGEKLLELLAK